LREHNIMPNLVVGDFDSLSVPPSGKYDVITLPAEKDDTDMAVALREGWSRGYRAFHIYGGTGGRMDHTLANISCLAGLAERGGRGYLYGDGVIITAIHNDTITFPTEARGTISVFSHSNSSVGVTERGLKYTLSGATMVNTNPTGVSNEFIGEPSAISVEDGTLNIIYPIME